MNLYVNRIYESFLKIYFKIVYKRKINIPANGTYTTSTYTVVHILRKIKKFPFCFLNSLTKKLF